MQPWKKLSRSSQVGALVIWWQTLKGSMCLRIYSKPVAAAVGSELASSSADSFYLFL